MKARRARRVQRGCQSPAGVPLPLVLMAIFAVTILLSIFLNNVATAIIRAPLAIDAAGLLGVSPDAALLAVLVVNGVVLTLSYG